MKSYYLVSLGCAKNTVDSESMAALLDLNDYRAADTPNQADILIVNTCGFIAPARQESIEVLQDLAKQKKPHQKLIAAGCMPEIYTQMIIDQVDGIDGIMGGKRWMDIITVLEKLARGGAKNKTLYQLPIADTIGKDEHGIHRIARQGRSAYLKIADGCRRQCAFCSIPLIKGSLVSRDPQTIIQDAIHLQSSGINELVLIAQDTTDYGTDFRNGYGVTQLLTDMLPQVPTIPWIRLLYAYPGCVTRELIELMAKEPQILPYLDIPLQHADPELLKKMNRPSDLDWVYRTIENMRSLMPGLALRTTFIVGYPGETEAAFENLLKFVKEIRFDRVGVFPFFFEQDTPSAKYGDPIPDEVKEQRIEQLMLLQQQISLEKNRDFLGKTLQVLVEGVDSEQNISIGRSYRDAPEIDGLVIIHGSAKEGDMINVRITDAMPHDLVGTIIN